MFPLIRQLKSLTAQLEHGVNVEEAIEELSSLEDVPLSIYEAYNVRRLLRAHKDNFHAKRIVSTIKRLKREEKRREEESMRTPMVPAIRLRITSPFVSGRVKGPSGDTPMRKVAFKTVRKLTEVFPEEKTGFEQYLERMGAGFSLKIKFTETAEGATKESQGSC